MPSAGDSAAAPGVQQGVSALHVIQQARLQFSQRYVSSAMTVMNHRQLTLPYFMNLIQVIPAGVSVAVQGVQQECNVMHASLILVIPAGELRQRCAPTPTWILIRMALMLQQMTRSCLHSPTV